MAAAADESTPPDMATAIFIYPTFRVIFGNALEYRRIMCASCDHDGQVSE